MISPKLASLPFYTKCILLAFTCAHLGTGLAMLFFKLDPLGLTGTLTPGADLLPHVVYGFGVRQAAIAVPMLIAFLFDDRKAAIAALGGFVTRCYLDVVAQAIDGFPAAPPLGNALGATVGAMFYPIAFTSSGTLAAIAIYLCAK